jgi:small subunit ribosomal protein S6
MAAAAELYEAMYILENTLSEEETAEISSSLQEAVTSYGGEFVSDELFGRRRLAYPIAGHVEGVYRLLYFRGEGAVINEIKHQFLLHDRIIRGMVVVANPKALFPPPERRGEETADVETPPPVEEAEGPSTAESVAEATVPAAETAAEEPTPIAPGAEATEEPA